MVRIRDAFHATDFALPELKVQPPGGKTLVTLPTYFEVDWPAKGFEPNEVDQLNPAQFLGLNIKVKPTLESVTYHLGADQSIGPTESLGGPYPNGDIVATYEDPGSNDVRPDVVYKGWVSVDDLGWMEIPGTVDLTGQTDTLDVLTASNRLYTPGGG